MDSLPTYFTVTLVVSTGMVNVMFVFPFSPIVPVPTRVVPSYTSMTPSTKAFLVTLSRSVTSIVVLPTVLFTVLISIMAVRLAILILDNVSSV